MSEDPRSPAPVASEPDGPDPFGPDPFGPDPFDRAFEGDGGTGESSRSPWASAGDAPDVAHFGSKGDSLRDGTWPEDGADLDGEGWSGEHRPLDDLTAPAPPAATRLNRLAVVVAAAVMSLTLLVIAFAIGGGGEVEEETTGARTARSGSNGTFLDRPLGPDSLYAATDPITGLTEEELARGELSADELNLLLGSEAASGLVPPPYGTSGAYGAPSGYEAAPAYAPAPSGSPSGSGSAGARDESPRVQALDRARRSSLAPQGVGGLTGGVASGASPEGAATPAPGEGAAAYLHALQAANVGPDASGLLTPRFGLPDAAAGGPQASGPSDAATVPGGGLVVPADGRYLATSVERPRSPYEVRAGTVVEAALLTGIHSDLPGEVVAQVSRNVFDSGTQQVVLIPRGSRLVGTYDNAIALDQGRLLVAWTRLVFPDGRSLALPGLGSTDPSGASGLPGRVDRHFFRAFGNALMLAVVGGGLSVAASRASGPGGTFGYPSPGEIMAGSVATELSRVATEILRGNVNRRPTIRVPAGARFAVFVSGDLALAPYVAGGR
jgi:hypothetical protein